MYEFPSSHLVDTKSVRFSVGCKKEDCKGHRSLIQFDRRIDAAVAWNTR